MTAVATHWFEHWDPQDASLWNGTGRRAARRNLIFSIFGGFGVIRTFVTSIGHIRAADAALRGFIACCAVRLNLIWACYLRRNPVRASLRATAEREVARV